MKKILLTLITATSLVFSATNARDKIKSEPSTKLEKIQELKGSILIKGYTDIGFLYGKYGKKLTTTLFQFDDKKSNTQTFGLNVEVETSDKYNKTSSSYIDYNELSSLIKGLEYIEKITSNPTDLQHYEASYSTNGGLKIINFNTADGALVVIQVGKYNEKAIYLKPANLKDFKATISKGLLKIRKLKGKKK